MKMLTKTRHNKKRNTAFLYEALVRELTRSIVAKDEKRKGAVVSLVREHFAPGSVLRKELDLYRALYETRDLEPHVCEKLVSEVKKAHSMLDKKAVFEEQTALINKINHMLSKKIFANFIPNYKDLATISQILNPDVPVKHRVLLESTLVSSLSSASSKEGGALAPMDNLVYKTFVKKFNDQYSGKLLSEQSELLGRYIASFHDDGVELKVFLNEEISRLKNIISKSTDDEEISQNPILLENAKRVLSLMEGYREQNITSQMIEQVLKIQSLAREMQN